MVCRYFVCNCGRNDMGSETVLLSQSELCLCSRCCFFVVIFFFFRVFRRIVFLIDLSHRSANDAFHLTRCALWSYEVDLRTSMLYTFPQIRVLLLPRQCQGSMKLVRRRSDRGWWALSFLACNVESDKRVFAQSCHRCHPPKSTCLLYTSDAADE